MLVFSFTKSQPLKIIIGDDVFVYVWYDKLLRKWKMGVHSPNQKNIDREKIDIEEFFKGRREYNDL